LSSIDSTWAPRTTNSPRAGSDGDAGEAVLCAVARPGQMLAAAIAVVAANNVRRPIAGDAAAGLFRLLSLMFLPLELLFMAAGSTALARTLTPNESAGQFILRVLAHGFAHLAKDLAALDLHQLHGRGGVVLSS